MKLNTSYRQIFSISVPIMLGSAAQNVIVLTDNVFLFHKSSLEFASVGIVGVFYLIIASIGYAISRGGQIIIARRFGEGNNTLVGKNFYAILYLELLIGLFLFLFIQFGSPWFFGYFLDNQEIYEKCLAYIYPRSLGIFFSYCGVALIALYTGIARTKFIIVDTLILTAVNLVLNYVLIFGRWGFPEMGISGAGWASTIAEGIAFLTFVLYMIFDRENRVFNIFQLPQFNWDRTVRVFTLSTPIVAQVIISLGSWFFFFTLIENMGQRELEISNLIRNVYLILSIPCWGYSAGINTLVSNFIGQFKRQAVVPIIWKTTKVCLASSLLVTLPVVIFPEILLFPLFGDSDPTLFIEAKPLFWLLLAIISLFSVGAIYFNGMVGTGATFYGLKIQAIAAVFYLIYIYLIINVFKANLVWAWASEILYWLIIMSITYSYLQSKKWYQLKV